MKLDQNTFILLDRADYKQSDKDADFAGQINLDGKVVALQCREVEGDFGKMLVGSVVDWETVKSNPKYYGLTEKQARDAELNGAEF